MIWLTLYSTIQCIFEYKMPWKPNCCNPICMGRKFHRTQFQHNILMFAKTHIKLKQENPLIRQKSMVFNASDAHNHKNCVLVFNNVIENGKLYKLPYSIESLAFGWSCLRLHIIRWIFCYTRTHTQSHMRNLLWDRWKCDCI